MDDVDAPRDIVWRHVVEFHDIEGNQDYHSGSDSPTPFAHALRDRASAPFAGANFQREPSSEPITVWDAPARLAFDVTEQPPPLREWSLYNHVYAPHIHGFFRFNPWRVHTHRISGWADAIRRANVVSDRHPPAWILALMISESARDANSSNGCWHKSRASRYGEVRVCPSRIEGPSRDYEAATWDC